ncbi:hypothetical protein R5W24_004425 [Gemmata sp. JC717]|uniref:hypothetical protein n=1 Tax=Gemmata algarum TaxID=2975278 RepID=UPI0021BA3FEC|nr:hypothetical protein [Gemmata algarum]MDY3555284.1 hypothetical protein [Gemmata algarum]
MFTHFKATVPVGYFPLYGELSESSLLVLANNGNTPTHPTRIAELQPEVDRLRSLLTAGKVATTKTATIEPLTREQYDAHK